MIKVYATTNNAKEAEVEQSCENLHDILEITLGKKKKKRRRKKRCPSPHRGLECKSGKSRGACDNRQDWPGEKNEAGQRLTEFC